MVELINMEKRFWLILLTMFSVVFFLIMYVSSFMLLVGYKDNKFEENDNVYVISHFDTFSNKATFGYSKIPSGILKNNEEFITFRSKNNEIFSVISSKFSNDKFECSGTCSCNNNNQERRSVNILSKSLYFIISAFSLSLALKIAANYFSEECFLSLRNSCSYENIESGVHFCESKEEFEEETKEYPGNQENSKILKKEQKKTEEKEISTEKIIERSKIKEEENDYQRFEREFYCEGYCTPNGNLRRSESKLESEKFECEKYTTGGKVTIIEVGKRVGVSGDENFLGLSKARVQFRKQYLIQYCKSISEHKYEYVYTYPSGVTKLRKRSVHLCVGSNRGEVFSNYDNICCSLLKTHTGRNRINEKEV